MLRRLQKSIVVLVSLAPMIAHAQGQALSIAPFLNKINRYILNPIIGLAFAVAFLIFFWGIFQFILHNDGEKEREEGKRNMMWGIIGMFIMVSVYGIIALITSSFGFDTPGYIESKF